MAFFKTVPKIPAAASSEAEVLTAMASAATVLIELSKTSHSVGGRLEKAFAKIQKATDDIISASNEIASVYGEMSAQFARIQISLDQAGSSANAFVKDRGK